MIIKINGVTISNTLYNSNFTEDRKRTKELDNGKLTIVNHTDDEAFDVDSTVEVTIDTVVRRFLIAIDDFKRTSRNPDNFEHILELVEDTYYLEGITFPNRRFVQPVDGVLGDGDTYSVWDQLVILQETAELLPISDSTVLWTYSTAVIPSVGVNLETYTDAIKAKQATINTPNARQSIDRVLAQIGMESRMTGFTEVGADFINAKNNDISNDDFVVYKGKQIINQYADRLDMFVENAISEADVSKQAIVYPSVAWASVRGTDSFLTSDNFVMEVEYPIDRILKFEIYVETTITLSTGPVVNIPATFTADITELLTEKTAYDSLLYNLTSFAGGYSDTVCRNNSVYFTKGGKRIEGFHEEIDQFNSFGGGLRSYNHLLAYAYWKSTATPVYSGEVDNYENFMFRLTYVPQQKERLRLEKKKPNKTRTLYYNQDERIPDVEKLGRKVAEDIERLGNKTLVLGKRVSSYTNVFELGDYYNDYITERVVNYRDKGEIVSTAFLSKGASNISLDVGINTESRDTSIDAKGAVVRQELYNEYLLIDYTDSGTNDTFVTSLGLQRYSEFLSNTGAVVNNPVEICRFSHDGDLVKKIIGCSSKGTANVIKFDFGFDSVNVIGRRTQLVDGLWVSEWVEYTQDELARLSTFYIDLAGDYTIDTLNIANASSVAQALPYEKVTLTTVNNIYITNAFADRFDLQKDGGEIFKMTYQLSHFDNTPNDDILIGDRLSTFSTLVAKDNEVVYLLQSSTPFPDRQKILASEYDDKFLITNTGPVPPGSIEVNFSNTVDRIKIDVADTGVWNWAIVNDDGDVYLRVNNTSEKTIYIKPRKNRS